MQPDIMHLVYFHLLGFMFVTMFQVAIYDCLCLQSSHLIKC